MPEENKTNATSTAHDREFTAGKLWEQNQKKMSSQEVNQDPNQSKTPSKTPSTPEAQKLAPLTSEKGKF